MNTPLWCLCLWACVKVVCIYGTSRWLSSKESTCNAERHRRCRFDQWVAKIPWRRKRQPSPVFLHGKSYGRRSLVGYSPWGSKNVRHDSALTHTHNTYLYIKNDITPYTCIWLYNQLLLDFCSNFSPRLILLLFTIYILMSMTQVTADVLEILHVCACFQSLSHVQLFATLWTVAPSSSSAHGVF